ncbi:hypothetical protein GGR58DRAFT_517148 [Xylaria digitata]|nr:hypothetical protein GGR58DRAFT_517148 [Xylaria digitata]
MSGEGEVQNDETTQVPVMTPGIVTGERSLGTLYSNCLTSYQNFLIKCSRNDSLESSLGLERCYEEYSRLKIWGYQRRATLMPSVPGSLAAIVHDNPELQNTLFEIYEQIIDSFHRIGLLPLELLVESLDLLVDGYNTDNDSEILSDISDNSSPDDDLEVASGILRCVFENIEELYSCQQEFQHVRQKLIGWQKEQEDAVLQDQGVESASKRVEPLKKQTEETATPELIAKRQFAEEIRNSLETALSCRLALANTKRRLQLQYWDAYPYRIDPETETASPIVQEAIVPPSRAFIFSTVARSAIVPGQANPDKNEAINTIYAPSLVGRNMNVRSNWKRHVFRDLRPYVCTFSDCLDPDRLFTTRRDWKYHEMQLHRRQWICQSCNCEYTSKSEMASHIRYVHNSSIKDRELNAVLDISERPIDEAHVYKCPFCYGTMSMKKLFDHMAYHMEALALFSLPRNHEDTKETEEALSHIAGAPQAGSLSSARKSTPSYSSHSSAGSQTHNIRPEPSTTVRKETRDSSHSSPKKSDERYIFYCCECGHGPWNTAVYSHCQNCVHRQCTNCQWKSDK